jgi:hypothetical protein
MEAPVTCRNDASGVSYGASEPKGVHAPVTRVTFECKLDVAGVVQRWTDIRRHAGRAGHARRGRCGQHHVRPQECGTNPPVPAAGPHAGAQSRKALPRRVRLRRPQALGYLVELSPCTLYCVPGTYKKTARIVKRDSAPSTCGLQALHPHT